MRRIATAIFALLLSTGCKTLIVPEQPPIGNDTWALTMTSIYKVASHLGHNVTYYPKEGYGMYRVYLKIANKTSAKQTFDFSGCYLASGKRKWGVYIVDMDKAINVAVTDKKSNLSANETVTRILIINFPDGKRFDTFACSQVGEIPIPETQPST
ncbi:MAG: hypothetical protein K8S54_02005 [Spirochaetia bacterium]|nr:hypothetical protein [Spirochaetia bacterium]